MEERYTELFQNVYGAKNEHPLNKIEEKREEIKDIVKEAFEIIKRYKNFSKVMDLDICEDDIEEVALEKLYEEE